ncbi:asparaginyl-tRNA synthetase [Serendipita sp. 405]|nr:asparaginyl-tRNA synthetase [Serendipita sp. 397]KAG8793591.1 asparaginyl-tRNA synthetase [Serendipita sp. 398]KAG8858313.1 asparaginyl-tRNA synthetase [Serendipita sp. 405]
MHRSLRYLRPTASRRLFSSSKCVRSDTLPKTVRQLLAEGLRDVQEDGSRPDETVVRGWVKSVRRQKKIAFAQVSDGTDLDARGLQVVFERPELAENLNIGTSVAITGSLVKSPGSGQSLEFQARNVNIVGACDPEEYPIQKKSHTTEYLRENAHFRARTSDISRMLRLRHAAKRAFDDYYELNGFINVHAPIITLNDCEGGGDVFRVLPDSQKTLSTPEEVPNSGENSSSDFFGSPAYLTVSSQLHLEVFASALSRVYTLQPAFRAEGSQTNRHLSEFWMLEAEMAFMKDLDQVMDVAEASIRHTLQDSRLRDALYANLPRSSTEPLPVEKYLGNKWPRVTYTQAVEDIQSGLGPDSIQWGNSISAEQERWIARHYGHGLPVFVTDYPTSLKPFYMRRNSSPNDDPTRSTVACFDLLVPEIGELAGGSLREERLEQLQEAVVKHGLDPDQYKWYTELRRFGTTPHGGFGVGFERYISWVGGWENIRECIPAPRWKGRSIL